MPGLSENIIDNNINNLSCNTPVALVVGAAGFIGSHLTEELLKKDIQVIGVDNFSTGKKENLTEAVKYKKFHLINITASDLNIKPSRLDYIFIITGPDWSLLKVLEIAKNLHSKVVFVSKIDLYDRNIKPPLIWYRNTEAQIARFATDNNINARVVRLAPIFGPRMRFNEDDPAVRLIQASLLGELQKESTALEFSTRALFVNDAVNLILKSMLSGSTAQKIFDGVNEPVKVSEIKQILLDPLWHETRRFIPSELPPWVTPNLENTKRHLPWKPETNIVTALRSTLHYFKEKEIEVPRPDAGSELKEKVSEWKKDIERGVKEDKKKLQFFSKQKFIYLLLWAVIIYGLIFPAAGVLWNAYLFRQNVLLAETNLYKGEVGESLENISAARDNLIFTDGLVSSLKLPLEVGVLNQKLEAAKNYLIFYDETLISLYKSLSGAQTLYQSFQVISGEKDAILKDEAQIASSQLESAYLGLSETLLNLQRNNIRSLPFINMDYYLKLTSQNKSLAKLLPKALFGKSYLILIEDNRKLVGSGGEILSVSRIDFENGKIKQIETESAQLIDSKITISIDPPQLLKKDLNIQKGEFRYSNFDGDFPTAARLVSWFYNKSKGKTPDGVISIDIEALEKLLEITGQLSPEGKETIITPELVNKLLNKIFFVTNLNWPQITNWFGSNIESKHIMVYFENKQIFSYLLSEGFSGNLPGPLKDQSDFLSIFETAVGGEKSNINLDRRLNLATKIDSQGSLSHTLKVGYINANGLNLSNRIRMRIYLPAGSKVIKASFGETDLMKDSTSTIEYGRLVYSFVFEILPKMQKSLIFEYLTPFKLNIHTDKLNYRLDIIKQPGTVSDSLEWRIMYPESLKTNSQTNIITDLRQDRSFAVEFKK